MEEHPVNRSLDLLKEEVNMVVEIVGIADDIVVELQKTPVNAGAVAQHVMRYIGSRKRIAAFFKENPTT